MKYIKSTQSKGYGIGHKKNFNKFLKSVVNAKKPNANVFTPFVLEFSICIIKFGGFLAFTHFYNNLL